MSALAGWALDGMIASTLLMAAVLLVRAPVRRLVGPEVAYTLWSLPLLRLVLPPLPAGWRAAATPIDRAKETMVLVVAPPHAAAAAPAAAMPSIGAMLAVLWLVGAAAFLLFHLVRHRRFCRRILAGTVSRERVGGIRVVTSAAAPGPLAFGLLRRYVALPVDMAGRYDADERALALAHEIGHHRRGDLLANWLALGALAIHWFDPVAWRAFRAFRADQEFANDARVLTGRSPDERHAYACAIVKAAHGRAVQGRAVAATCHLHPIADLKGRLTMLATARRRLASGAAGVGALVVAGLALTASGSSAAAIGARVGQAVAPPAPAATPASAPISGVEVTEGGRTTHRDDLTSADIDARVATGERIAIKPPVRGGTRMIVKMPDDPAMLVEVQSIPTVSQATCGIGSGAPASMVIDTGKGPKRRIVICTDRIRAQTASAMTAVGSSHDIERNAYAQALAGLTDARGRMAANTDMTEADRTRALTAIDQAIAEMKGQLARFN